MMLELICDNKEVVAPLTHRQPVAYLATNWQCPNEWQGTENLFFLWTLIPMLVSA